MGHVGREKPNSRSDAAVMRFWSSRSEHLQPRGDSREERHKKCRRSWSPQPWKRKATEAPLFAVTPDESVFSTEYGAMDPGY